MQAIHDNMVSKVDFVDSVVRALDSRGKGKLDMIEIRTLLIKVRFVTRTGVQD